MISLLQPTFLLQQHTNVTLNYRLLFLVGLLISIGVVIVASASIDFASVTYGDPWFFVKRHLIYICLLYTSPSPRDRG